MVLSTVSLMAHVVCAFCRVTFCLKCFCGVVLVQSFHPWKVLWKQKPLLYLFITTKSLFLFLISISHSLSLFYLSVSLELLRGFTVCNIIKMSGEGDMWCDKDPGIMLFGRKIPVPEFQIPASSQMGCQIQANSTTMVYNNTHNLSYPVNHFSFSPTFILVFMQPLFHCFCVFKKN